MRASASYRGNRRRAWITDPIVAPVRARKIWRLGKYFKNKAGTVIHITLVQAMQK